MVDGPVPNVREYAALFDISAAQLKLAEIAVLHALDWHIRCPTVCDYLHLFEERERGTGPLPPLLLHQLHEVMRRLPPPSRI